MNAFRKLYFLSLVIFVKFHVLDHDEIVWKPTKYIHLHCNVRDIVGAQLIGVTQFVYYVILFVIKLLRLIKLVHIHPSHMFEYGILRHLIPFRSLGLDTLNEQYLA